MHANRRRWCLLVRPYAASVPILLGTQSQSIECSVPHHRPRPNLQTIHRMLSNSAKLHRAGFARHTVHRGRHPARRRAARAALRQAAPCSATISCKSCSRSRELGAARNGDGQVWRHEAFLPMRNACAQAGIAQRPRARTVLTSMSVANSDTLCA